LDHDSPIYTSQLAGLWVYTSADLGIREQKSLFCLVCVCVYVLVYVYEHVCLCVLTYCMCVHMFVRGHVSRAYVCTQTMQTCALLFHVCTAAVGTMSTFTHTVEGLWL
jgi:hypothetical protein